MRRLAAIAFSFFCIATAAAADELAPLSAPELMQRGLPAIDRTWSGADFATAAAVLKQVAPEQLPRSSDPATAAVIDRLVNTDTLDYCGNRGIALAARMASCLQILNAEAEILTLYADAETRLPALADDIVRLSGMVIQSEASTTGLLDELIPTLDKNDPSYAQRMAGVEDSKQGIAQTLDGGLQLLAMTQGISPPVRVNFAIAVAASWPALANYLPPPSRADFEIRLRKLAQNDPNPDVRAALAKFAAP
jgi:hypothetical protein